MAGPRSFHGSAVVGFKIYVVGGFNGETCFNTCRVFDALSKTWHEVYLTKFQFLINVLCTNVYVNRYHPCIRSVVMFLSSN